MQTLTLGPFNVDPEGVLGLRAPGILPELRFAWRGRTCDAALQAHTLRLASTAARIPSTAHAGTDRERALALLQALPKRLPSGWRLRLTPDHRIMLETEEVLASPPTATSLIAAMVRFSLALDPYLDALEEAGADLPPRRH